MSDKELLKEMLEQIDGAAEEIIERFGKIKSPDDFNSSPENRTIMDSICMKLIVIGEILKKIDKRTGGQLFDEYPEIPWKEAMGIRDVIAHDYFRTIPEEIFQVCKDDVPKLHKTLAKMKKEIV